MDTDLLYSFSKHLNLYLIFEEPEALNSGKMGEKVGDKWFNGSMALFQQNVL